jgi:hypothetical protein
MHWRGILAFVLFGAAILAAASDEQGLKAVRVTKPPTIDGTINDDEWKEVPFVEGLHDADTGAPYADDGRFWLAYDNEFVYFAARLKESDPHAIHATEYRTNVALTGDDYVELDLDLSGSTSAFNKFQINPQGATNIQIASGRAAKREWLGAFVAKGRVIADGWEIEAKIPWAGMDVPHGGKRNVRFNILRFVAKSQRKFSYVYVPMTQIGLTPMWIGVDLPKPSVDRSIKLLPYGYAGYDPKVNGVLNAGLDMKTALTDQINLVGTVNPDFRNIENQILSIDFSRFERLAGETRPFFQEGKQYSNSQIFASQRIREMDAGLNSYGRFTDQISFSLISTARFGHESDTIFNITEDPNPNTSIRATITDRELPGLANQATLLRLSQNLGPVNLFLRNMTSRDSAAGFGQQNDAVATYVKDGLALSGAWSRADKGFMPRLGFVPEVDLDGPSMQVDYSRNYNHGTISDWGGELAALSYNHADGSFYRKEAAASLSGTIRPGINLGAACDLADFEGSKDSLYSLQAQYPRGNPYSNLTVHYDTGRQAGIQYRSIAASSAYRFMKKLQLSLRHQHVDYAGPSDQTIFSLSYDLDHDRAIAGRLVRQGSDTNAYIAYQRSGNAGAEYFLILGDPNAPKFRASLILKVVIPFSLGR